MSFFRFFTGTQATSFEESIQQLPLRNGAKIVSMQQVHGTNIQEIDLGYFRTQQSENTLRHANQFEISQNTLQKNNISKNRIFIPNADACFTTEKNVFISVKTADCLPILISGIGKFGHSFVAGAHAGRKGTQSKILSLLLDTLHQKYAFTETFKEKTTNSCQKKIGSAKKQKLTIWFGPAICKNCYQIDRITDTHFDLLAENKKQLQEFCSKHGLRLEECFNLEIETHCTFHEPEKYYSYREFGSGVPMNYSYIASL